MSVGTQGHIVCPDYNVHLLIVKHNLIQCWAVVYYVDMKLSLSLHSDRPTPLVPIVTDPTPSLPIVTDASQ